MHVLASAAFGAVGWKKKILTLRRERSLVLKHRDVSAYLVSCRENSTLLEWMIGPRQEGWMNSFVTLLSNLKPPSPWQKHLDFAEAHPCKIQWGRRCHRSQSKASIGHIARGRGRFNALLRSHHGQSVRTSKYNTCSDLFSLTQEPRIQDKYNLRVACQAARYMVFAQVIGPLKPRIFHLSTRSYSPHRRL